MIQPLIKAANGPNGAISLTQTLNRILFYFCNRQYFGVQEAKNGDRGPIVFTAVKSALQDLRPTVEIPFRGDESRSSFNVWMGSITISTRSSNSIKLVDVGLIG